MMKVDVVNVEGKKLRQVELPAEVFEAPINVDLMHQAYVRQMANARLGTHKTKSRGEVSGGGHKPWKQKGTGRARQGTTRAPQWVGGGRVHTPRPRSYEKKMPRKMRQAALRSVLSVKAAEESVIVVDDFILTEPKTRLMAGALGNIVGEASALLLLPEKDSNYELVVRTAGNIPNTKVLLAGYLNIRDILGFDKLVISLKTLDALKAHLG
ncbi:MAG: 50S ribosomal protein L4 [Anaerolineae bacterium]|nr:50S ribosomal protein L4 [Anaerolineae bacterium]MBT7074587.1 50S ribosomal protein L4 [Anaerolineae bacterium]MBT7989373.1 50S ribosomal protein L4 [Anaerolineae bacterium]